VIVAWLIACWVAATAAVLALGWSAEWALLVVLVVFWTGAGIGWLVGRLRHA
jgi:hypothetical protein